MLKRIAIASEGTMVGQHFGHCEGFTMYELGDEKVMKQVFIPNPGHKPGYLPVFLKEQGADVIIAGGMGETAQELFASKGIQVIVGAEGSCEDVIRQYREGVLKSTGSICREHAHEGHCNE